MRAKSCGMDEFCYAGVQFEAMAAKLKLLTDAMARDSSGWTKRPLAV